MFCVVGSIEIRLWEDYGMSEESNSELQSGDKHTVGQTNLCAQQDDLEVEITLDKMERKLEQLVFYSEGSGGNPSEN